MVNEDILTSLKNAVERGESLENAIKILINSGYSFNEVQEASRFIGFVPQQNNQESLIMPEQKGFFSKFGRKNTVDVQPVIPSSVPKPVFRQPMQQQPQTAYPSQQPQRPYALQQLPQRTPSSQELKTEIAPKPYQFQLPSSATSQSNAEKPNYKKEIMLLMILLILIGILIATLLFKDKILAFFS